MADEQQRSAQTPFHDLDGYVALARTAGVTVSPDGTRLVTAVATLNADKTKYVNAVWQVDPLGERAARRLTRSAKGEADAAFLPNGDLLFRSARPDPDAKESDDEVPMLWLLPAAGGEARVVAKRPGGIGRVVAREAGTIVVSSDTLLSSTDSESEETKRKARKERKVSAILHERFRSGTGTTTLGQALPGCSSGRSARTGASSSAT